MVKVSQSNTSPVARLIFWAACCGLILSFSIFVLEKSSVTNFYSKPTNHIDQPSPILGVSPVNTIDYSPTSDEEKSDGETIKQQAADQANSPEQSTNNSTISVSLSAAGQDEKGGPIIVRTIVNGDSSGTCSVVIKNSNISKEYSAVVVNSGTYNSCNGFDIPVNEIPAGSYSLILTVVSGNNKGTVTQQVEVSK